MSFGVSVLSEESYKVMHYFLSCATKRSVIFYSECTIQPFVDRAPPGLAGGAHTAPQTPMLDLGEGSQNREGTQMKEGDGSGRSGKRKGIRRGGQRQGSISSPAAYNRSCALH